MSKYIRTKDKIFEVVEENERYYKCCYDDGRITLAAKFDNDVNGFSKALNQADTIEELCDEFVCYGNNTYSLLDRITTIDKYAVFKDKSADRVSNLIKAGCEFYGAVWCEWGLKYVAKMNEKGELELL